MARVDQEALERLNAHLGFDSGAEKLWSTRMDFIREAQRAWVFRYEQDGVTQIAALAEYAEPWTLPVPDWDSLRKGGRERETDVLELYLGREIYALRAPGEPDEKMLGVAERVRKSALKHPQATAAEVVEVVRVPKFGGTQVTVERTMAKGRRERVNKAGRIISLSKLTLDACFEHATWAFLAKDFLPRRNWRRGGWG